ncbi:unnamed protein product [Penicillium olsonii]|nr:unnamed protein product [Penicillium olsonii]CAG7930241.1 unnamed protein product [Penicillium olsonii]
MPFHITPSKERPLTLNSSSLKGDKVVKHGSTFYRFGDFANLDTPGFPRRTDDKTKRRFQTCVIYSCLFVLVGILAVGIYITVIFLKADRTGLDLASPGYDLYKNTMFEECYNRKPSNITSDCPGIRSKLQSQDSSELKFYPPTSKLRDILKDHGLEHTWCDIMSCFSDFKVIPSTPRPSAFWPSLLEVWCKLIITFIAAFWELKNLQEALYSDRLCHGLEMSNWVFVLWDTACFVWWCVGLGLYFYNKQHYPAPYILGWISLWKYTNNIHYHPYKCTLKRSPRFARFADRALSILMIGQWAFCLYLFVVNWHVLQSGYSPEQAYECLALGIPTAPGLTPCSPEQICSKHLLFHSVLFDYHSLLSFNGTMALVSFFLVGTTLLAVMLCARLVFPCMGFITKRKEKWRKTASHLDLGFAASMGIAFFCCIGCAVLTAIDARQAMGREREGPVAFDWECTAVHVNLSPWRYYLDVSDGFAIRMARNWFSS